MIPIHYTLTLEDYLEANGLHRGKSAWLMALTRVVLAWLPLGITLLGSGSAQTSASSSSATTASSISGDIAAPLLPYFVILFASWYAVRVVFRTSSTPWRGRMGRIFTVGKSAWPRVVMVSVAVAGVVAIINFRLNQAEALLAIDPTAPSVTDVVFALLPLAAVTGFLIFGFSMADRRYKRTWDMLPNLHRPLTADFSEIGLTISEPSGHSAYRWEYFPGFLESRNHFVIYVTALAFHIIPKRAFMEPSQVEGVRALLMRIAHRVRTGGFPVGFPVPPPLPGTGTPEARPAPVPVLPQGRATKRPPGIEPSPPFPIIPRFRSEETERTTWV